MALYKIVKTQLSDADVIVLKTICILTVLNLLTEIYHTFTSFDFFTSHKVM